MPESQVTAARVEEEYKTNLKNMNKDSTASITANFVDVAMTVAKRMLGEPEIAHVLRDMDEHFVMGGDAQNPFNSHSRLQAMIDKCKKPHALLWCVQCLAHKAKRGTLTSLSIGDIKGNAANGNRGIFDLFIFKEKLRDAMIAHGLAILSKATGASEWITNTVAKHTASFATWGVQEDARDLRWRAGRSEAQIVWLNLLIEIVFGKSYDTAIKVSIRNGDGPEDALQSPGISQAMECIEEKFNSEEKPPEDGSSDENGRKEEDEGK
jgi:hypothetical protein